MVKTTVCLVRRAVKTDWKNEVDYFRIHDAKVGFYFGFRKTDFRFLWRRQYITLKKHFVIYKTTSR
jgi:hypothetical protein